MRSKAQIEDLLTSMEKAMADPKRRSTQTSNTMLYVRIEQLKWVLGRKSGLDDVSPPPTRRRVAVKS